MYELPDQSGRRVLVTGANSGLGEEATKRLAAAGATVIMACRSTERAEAARERIRHAVPTADLEIRRLDLSDLSDVRAFAEALRAEGSRLDVLINNAGVMTPPDRLLTVDGHELQWGTNFLGPFALTNLLLPLLLDREDPRLVTMTSGMAGVGSIRFADLDWERGYSSERAYAQSKLADLLMGLHLAKIATSRGWPLRSVLAHPGYTRTNLQVAGAALGTGRPTLMSRIIGVGSWTGQDSAQGAEPLLYAAADPAAANGGFYGPTKRFGMVGPAGPAKIFRSATGPTLAASLWTVAESLTGTSLPD